MEFPQVLVIDDSITVHAIVEEYLDRTHTTTLKAKSCDEAASILKLHEGIKFILCDYNMPGINGIETIKLLRKEHKDNLPPIFMLTTETSRDVMNQAKELGVKGWIIKPVKFDALTKLVEKYCY